MPAAAAGSRAAGIMRRIHRRCGCCWGPTAARRCDRTTWTRICGSQRCSITRIAGISFLPPGRADRSMRDRDHDFGCDLVAVMQPAWLHHRRDGGGRWRHASLICCDICQSARRSAPCRWRSDGRYPRLDTSTAARRGCAAFTGMTGWGWRQVAQYQTRMFQQFERTFTFGW